MIRSFRHKGLKKFFEAGATSGMTVTHAKKIARSLAVLDELSDSADLNGLWHCHPLTDDRFPQWSLRVTGNWRITFEFEKGDVYIVNYEDYH